MDTFTMNELRDLLKEEGEVCVSIYIPTFEKGPETEQNQIRFKNALGEAQNQLKERNNHRIKENDFLKPARQLLKDNRFWRNQGLGLAVFLSGSTFRTYRLPQSVHELTVIKNRFHVKPLLPLLTEGGSFYLLALSQQKARLFHGNLHYLQEIHVREMPHGMSEALLHEESEKQLQYHTGDTGGSGMRPAIFHGHGVGTDDKKDKILRYCRQVERAIHSKLHDKKDPLLLACVDYLFPIYSEVNSYPYFSNHYLNGNPDHLKESELHKLARPIMENHFRRDLEKARADYEALKQGQKTSKNLEKIVRFAIQGRVERLFVPKGVQKWGIVEENSDRVHIHPEKLPGDEDLLDLAALETVTKGGRAYLLNPEEMPEGAPAAAIFRF